MIELRLNEFSGKYERPAPDAFGRVYRIVNQMTGEVGFNCTSSDLPGLDPARVKMIEEYDTFGGWMTEIISVEDTYTKVMELNAGPKVVLDTPHTELVARVRHRLKVGTDLEIDGHAVLDDMREMYADIMGRGRRGAVDGWRA